MGSGESKTETKSVEASGQVNNSMVLNNTQESYGVAYLVLLSILCGIKIIEFLIFLYVKYNSALKKKYTRGDSAA